MLDFVPTNKNARQTGLADLSLNIAIFGNGVGLLAAQIFDLENRCRAMRSRTNHKRSENAREASLARMSVS